MKPEEFENMLEDLTSGDRADEIAGEYLQRCRRLAAREIQDRKKCTPEEAVKIEADYGIGLRLAQHYMFLPMWGNAYTGPNQKLYSRPDLKN